MQISQLMTITPMPAAPGTVPGAAPGGDEACADAGAFARELGLACDPARGSRSDGADAAAALPGLPGLPVGQRGQRNAKIAALPPVATDPTAAAKRGSDDDTASLIDAVLGQISEAAPADDDKPPETGVAGDPSLGPSVPALDCTLTAPVTTAATPPVESPAAQALDPALAATAAQSLAPALPAVASLPPPGVARPTPARGSEIAATTPPSRDAATGTVRDLRRSRGDDKDLLVRDARSAAERAERAEGNAAASGAATPDAAASAPPETNEAVTAATAIDKPAAPPASAPAETSLRSVGRAEAPPVSADISALPAPAAAPTGSGATNAQPVIGDAPPTELRLPTLVTTPEFMPRFGAELTVLARDGVQEARVHVNPAEMGPIRVQITLDGQQAQVNLIADSALTRQVLEQSMPTLASALRESGLTLSGGGVFEQPPEQPREQAREAANDGHGSSGNRRGGEGGSAPQGTAGTGPDAPRGNATARAQRRQGVVDVYA